MSSKYVILSFSLIFSSVDARIPGLGELVAAATFWTGGHVVNSVNKKLGSYIAKIWNVPEGAPRISTSIDLKMTYNAMIKKVLENRVLTSAVVKNAFDAGTAYLCPFEFYEMLKEAFTIFATYHQGQQKTDLTESNHIHDLEDLSANDSNIKGVLEFATLWLYFMPAYFISSFAVQVGNAAASHFGVRDHLKVKLVATFFGVMMTQFLKTYVKNYLQTVLKNVKLYNENLEKSYDLMYDAGDKWPFAKGGIQQNIAFVRRMFA